MKNLINRTVILISLFLFLGLRTIAQEGKPISNKAKISIEIDPATFAFNGYGFHLRVQPKNSDHMLLGAGTYAMDFPNVLVNMNKVNRNMGWHVRLNQGYGLFSEYHFSEVNKKWFVGGQLALQEYKIQKDFYDGQAKYSNMMLMGLGGYTLQPFDFGLYFKFWGGIGYTGKIFGENVIDNAEYEISPIIPFGALHIGYTF